MGLGADVQQGTFVKLVSTVACKSWLPALLLLCNHRGWMGIERKKAKFEESNALTHTLIILLLYAEPKALSSAQPATQLHCFNINLPG